MRVFYTGVDCGDGSLNVEFYDSQECIDKLEELCFESYRGEGGGWFECDNFQGHLRTMSDVCSFLDEWTETL